MGRAACGSSTDLELSEPRRLSTGHWVVDVKRVSDERRMAEITLTAALLPPRTNAKGKVVWSLPTDKDVAPRLGLHEQRAVFADYRKQRKEKKDANRALAQVRKRDDVKREKAERWGARTIQSAWRATLARQRYRHAVAYTRTLPSAQPREWFPAPAEDVSSPDGTVCRQDSEASSATQRSHREEDFSRIPGGILDGDGGDEGDEEDDDQAAPQSWLAATSSMRTRSVDDNAVRPVDNGPSLATLVASIGQAVPEDDKRRWVSSWKLATVERLDELAEAAWREATNGRASRAQGLDIPPPPLLATTSLPLERRRPLVVEPPSRAPGGAVVGAPPGLTGHMVAGASPPGIARRPPPVGAPPPGLGGSSPPPPPGLASPGASLFGPLGVAAAPHTFGYKQQQQHEGGGRFC